MATIPPFRTFVNAFGINTRSILWPLQEGFSYVHTSVENLAYWYWCLHQITIDYSYTINEFPIHHRYNIDGTQFTLKERIQGGWSFGADNLMDAELGISTKCKLYLCQIYDHDLHMDPQDAKQQHLFMLNAQPQLCKDPLFPLNKIFSLTLEFQENAMNGDFRLHSFHNNSLGTILHTLHARFMNQALPIYLSTPYPKEIEGQINTFSITPELYTFQRT